MNTVFIVPTGIGAEIGGHSGDATPAARLIGSVSDKIILHPNVVNGSDINEMPPNALYVDGNHLDIFLQGDVGLKEVRANKVLVAINPGDNFNAINAVSACRATSGIDASVLILKKKLILKARIDQDGLATGEVKGVDALIDQVCDMDFDALAIVTEIEIDPAVGLNYFENGGANPWGAVESMACRPISASLCKPVAHAPIDSGAFKGVKMFADPRMAAEFVSIAYLFCVVKGLHQAPRWALWQRDQDAMWVKDIDVMVSPDMKFGYPHYRCMKHNIPILIVEENTTILPRAVGPCIKVANYHEAAGWIAARRAGISTESVRRPLPPTKVIR